MLGSLTVINIGNIYLFVGWGDLPIGIFIHLTQSSFKVIVKFQHPTVLLIVSAPWLVQTCCFGDRAISTLTMLLVSVSLPGTVASLRAESVPQSIMCYGLTCRVSHTQRA